ncbi:unnamed protein product [Effrenium voratum]|nr:unnamed protein product [Effrenium voratum]
MACDRKYGMHDCKVPFRFILLQLLIRFRLPAAWVLSSEGDSCDTACTGLGKTCDASRMNLVTSEYQMTYAIAQGGLTACDFYTVDADSYATAQPYKLVIDSNSQLPTFCFPGTATSDCTIGVQYLSRLCCCIAGGDDSAVVCPVPTTTSTTQTTTSQTTTSQTVTTSTATTVSITTTTLTTTTISTTTVTTETDTTTTQTQTTQTTTSETVSTTTFETSTVTVTTQTTTSATFTSSTATTITTTSSTVTTTLLASAVLVADVARGDTVIVIDSAVGFSLNDIAQLKGAFGVTDYVEIISKGTTTIGSRRLAVYDTLTVSPPVENDYVAGDAVVNRGPAAFFTGGDPVTYFGGQKWKFWMPLHEELLLLATPDVRLYGSVFPGPELGQQWFGDFLVAFPDDTPIAKVRIRAASNRTSPARRCGSPRFEALEIYLGKDTMPLKDMRHLEYTAGKSIRFEINCRNQAARTEYMYFETPSLVFVITSSHAGVEFPENPELAFKYMHLDFIVMEAIRSQTFSGILPEIWDVRPRSPFVSAMLQPPEPPMVCEADWLTPELSMVESADLGMHKAAVGG